VIEAGVDVLDAPFVAHGNVATAGGCLASQYLAAWIISRLAGTAEAEDALHYVAPVGEKALSGRWRRCGRSCRQKLR
jgi:transcriptional regulator GlxA family with amidase domain